MLPEPQYFEYRDQHPIYLDTPFKDIKPTKLGEGREWHPVERVWVSPQDSQIFRIAILEDNTVFIGEGTSIVHHFVEAICENLKLPCTKVKLEGIVYYLKSEIYIRVNKLPTGSGRYGDLKTDEEMNTMLPPHWNELITDAEVKFEWTRNY